MGAALSYQRLVNLKLREKARKRPTQAAGFIPGLSYGNFVIKEHAKKEVDMGIESDVQTLGRRGRGKGERRRISGRAAGGRNSRDFNRDGRTDEARPTDHMAVVVLAIRSVTFITIGAIEMATAFSSAIETAKIPQLETVMAQLNGGDRRDRAARTRVDSVCLSPLLLVDALASPSPLGFFGIEPPSLLGDLDLSGTPSKDFYSILHTVTSPS